MFLELPSSWAILLLMWRLSVGESASFTCESDEIHYKVCYDIRTEEEVFYEEYELSTKQLSLICKEGGLIEDYFGDRLLGEASLMIIKDCILSEEWVAAFVNQSTKILKLNQTNDAMHNSNNTYFLLNRLPLLEDLTLTNVPVDLKKDVFVKNLLLKSLTLERTCIETLPDWLFIHLQNLTHLFLRENCISNISVDLFLPLRNLEELHLSHNEIKELPTGIFDHLLFLNVLNLTGNELEELSNNLLLHNTRLKYLYLGGNDLHFLPANLLHNAKDIRYLDLSKNPLKALHSDFLKNALNLEYVYLDGCNLSSLSYELFEKAKNLRVVSAKGNTLSSITFTTFCLNHELEILDLSYNSLVSIVKDIEFPYGCNSKLKKLFLQHNNINDIDWGYFFGFELLEYLDLSSNFLQNVCVSAFGKLTRLLELNLSNNLLSKIWFKNSTAYGDSCLLDYRFTKNAHLRSLQLQNNILQIISDEDFSGLRSLRKLDLSNNLLNHIEEQAFVELANLQELDLSNNSLINLWSSKQVKSPPPSYGEGKKLRYLHLNFRNFRFANNINLRLLKLHDNSLRNISVQDLFGLRSLEILDISNNNISDINDNSFGTMEKLKYLDLRNNCLTVLPRFFTDDNLKSFFPERRNITSIQENFEFFPSNEIQIRLENNDITTVDLSLLNSENYGRREYFYLQNNSLICDCTLYDFYRYISQMDFKHRSVGFHMADTLTCFTPMASMRQKIKDFKHDSFTCEVLEDCPNQCICTLRKADEAVILECHGLSKLPDIIPKGVRVLRVANNTLTDLSGLKQKHWQNLEEIYADENSLSSDNPDHWYIPPNLQVLSLRNNRLTHLPESIIIHADSMPSFQMNLGFNPWSCDCSAITLKSWLSESCPKVPDASDIICSSEVEVNGSWEFMNLITMPDSLLCPPAEWPHVLWLILSISFTIIALIILTVSVAFFCKRNEKNVEHIS